MIDDGFIRVQRLLISDLTSWCTQSHSCTIPEFLCS